MVFPAPGSSASRKRNGWRGTAQHARKICAHGDRAKGRDVYFRNIFESAVEPTVVGGLESGRARFHEILRVEMRASGIGRASRVYDSEFVSVKERREGGQAWMQSEKAVKVHGAIRFAAARFRDRNGRTQAVIILFAEGNDDVESVGRAALKQYDELLFPGCRS